MKWRNQLLAFVCLLAFAGIGVVYFQHWVIRKPFGIIIFVGEGLSPARLAPTRIYAAGAGTRLNMDSMPYAALTDELLEGFRGTRSISCGDGNCHGRTSNESRHLRSQATENPLRASLNWPANTGERLDW